MPDFGFYTDAYLGTLIPEKHFDSCAARAKAALDFLDRLFTVTGGPEERKLALCAMAEAVFTARRRSGVVSASVGSVSVRYGDTEDERLWRELYRAAKIYLEVCRGVARC